MMKLEDTKELRSIQIIHIHNLLVHINPLQILKGIFDMNLCRDLSCVFMLRRLKAV